jgi:hypothetical protein
MRRHLVLAVLLLALAGCAARESGGVSGGYVGGALGGNARQGNSWR